MHIRKTAKDKKAGALDGDALSAAGPVPSGVRAAPLTPTGLLALQRSAGNAAASREVRRPRQEQGADHGSRGTDVATVQRAGSRSSSQEAESLSLYGSYIRQGNGKGSSVTGSNYVLYTSDLGPCVAVCGYNGAESFMVHSDSTTTGGVGRIDLITGINRVVSIGTGAGWTIELIGGSTSGTKRYLKDHLPDASIHSLGEAEGAYITGDGTVAKSKRRLAKALGVSSVSLV
jgi:hypothetical protein